MSKLSCGCVVATERNTPAVRHGFEMGGYVKHMCEQHALRACGVLAAGMIVRDERGCILPSGHQGPHEFIGSDGGRWYWETDMECDCDHCMKLDGDYCFTYWEKERSHGQRT